MTKKSFILILKFVLAVALIAWLIQKGKLDFSLFNEWFKQPIGLFLIFCVSLFNIFLVSLRYKLLLEFKSHSKLDWFKIVKSNWIGSFFNAVLPGSVSGDLLKIFYVHDDYPHLSKRFLLAGSFMDRILGLMGVILNLSLFCIIGASVLPNNPLIKTVIYTNHMMASAIVLGFIVVNLFGAKLLTFLRGLKFLQKIPKIEELFLFGDFIVELKWKLILLMVISWIVQFIGAGMFWALLLPFNLPLSIIQAMCIIPIGFVAIAIPIAPSGLGVGHVIFDQLFASYGVEGGANYFNIFFVLTLITNVIGFIPYLMHKKISIKNEEI